MRRPTQREKLLVVSVVFLVLLILWLRSCGKDPWGSVGRAGEEAGTGNGRTAIPFMIAGDLTRAISPGELVALDLTLTNTNDLAKTIDQITVTLAGIDAPNTDVNRPCTLADFHIRPLASGIVLTLPGRSTQTLSSLGVERRDRPAVGMHNHPVNQDGCKGASLTLRYQASGTEVPR